MRRTAFGHAAARAGARVGARHSRADERRSPATLELYRARAPFTAGERFAAELAGGLAALVLRAFGVGERAHGRDARPSGARARRATRSPLRSARRTPPSEVVRVAASVVGAPVGLLWERDAGRHRARRLVRARARTPTSAARASSPDRRSTSRAASRRAVRAAARRLWLLDLASARAGRRRACSSSSSRPETRRAPRELDAPDDLRRPRRPCAARERTRPLARARARSHARAARRRRAGDGRALAHAHARDGGRARCGAARGRATSPSTCARTRIASCAAATRGLAGPHVRVAERLLELAPRGSALVDSDDVSRRPSPARRAQLLRASRASKRRSRCRCSSATR